MAESIDSLVTPEKGESDDRSMSKSSDGNGDSLSNGRSTYTRPRRASVGSNHAGRDALTSSADKSGSSANTSQNKVPHYLRASTGSCHDFCKFGKAHSDETIARKPFRKRISKSLLTKTSPAEIPVEIFVSGGKKKKEVASGSPNKGEVAIDRRKNKEVVSGDKKKKEVASGNSPKKEEVDLDRRKKKEVVSGDKKGEVVTGDCKKEEAVSDDEKNEEVVSGGQKNVVVIKGGPRIGIKDHSTNQKPSPDTKTSLTKPRASLSKEKATTYMNNHSPTVPSTHNKSNLRKPKLSAYTKTYPSKQNGSSGSETLLPKHKPSSAKKSPSVDPPEIVKSVFFPYTEVEDSVKQGSSTDNKISRTEKKSTNMAKKQSSPVKLKSVKVMPSSAADDLDGMHRKGRRNSSAQTGRKLAIVKASAKKILTPPSATLPSELFLKKTTQTNSGKLANLKLVAPLKDRSRIRRVNRRAPNEEKVTEKTLHVVGVESGNNVSESIPGDNVISSPQSPLSAESSSNGKSLSLSSHEVDNSDSEEGAVEIEKSISVKHDLSGTGIEAHMKESHKKTMRKNRGVIPEDKHVSPVKVKFRMGKVVELQTDNNSPRRLRFRRARVLGAEEGKGDSRRKNSKKSAVNIDMAGTGVSSQKVVLKHQDVQGKKDAQGLLNNVIEETASKLAESRKSKVKALVGAFETVISLQESKPSTQVAS